MKKLSTEDVPKLAELCAKCLQDIVHFSKDETYFEYIVETLRQKDQMLILARNNDKISGFAIISLAVENDMKILKVIELHAFTYAILKRIVEYIEEIALKKKVDLIIAASPLILTKIKKDWIKVKLNALVAKSLRDVEVIEKLKHLVSKSKHRAIYVSLSDIL